MLWHTYLNSTSLDYCCCRFRDKGLVEVTVMGGYLLDIIEGRS